ncbi:unnamed protein product [Prunus armeniaca]|uniref:Uncharacterized protein n=1 Tax=Prunus armeniaca TaxID=36596 RepID=A0A6J5WL75_PRUAR|nr:unnamed protein product [Prunus armeniaca]CAB4301141.1 unnamed protein product [Prunus armeniaca]
MILHSEPLSSTNNNTTRRPIHQPCTLLLSSLTGTARRRRTRSPTIPSTPPCRYGSSGASTTSSLSSESPPSASLSLPSSSCSPLLAAPTPLAGTTSTPSVAKQADILPENLLGKPGQIGSGSECNSGALLSLRNGGFGLGNLQRSHSLQRGLTGVRVLVAVCGFGGNGVGEGFEREGHVYGLERVLHTGGRGHRPGLCRVSVPGLFVSALGFPGRLLHYQGLSFSSLERERVQLREYLGASRCRVLTV